VIPGVEWGSTDVLFTPAYWQRRTNSVVDRIQVVGHRLSNSLKAECVACLLGGHGIPAQVGLAAFAAIVREGIIERGQISQDDVLAILRRPLDVGGGQMVRYRFANEKSRCIAEFLSDFQEPSTPNHVEIRNWLVQFRGIGLKTASWIVRNWYDSDNVAILDIHIYRAGLIMGLFEPHQTIERDYLSLERKFLDFAVAINVRPSALDAVIWMEMKKAGKLVHDCMIQYNRPYKKGVRAA
jgi:thermostable 8-oxoguanine DNA glycosylase